MAPVQLDLTRRDTSANLAPSNNLGTKGLTDPQRVFSYDPFVQRLAAPFLIPWRHPAIASFPCDKEMMPVNRSESRALNTLLRGLGVHTAPWDHDGSPIPTSEQAMTALAMLADRANASLGTGPRGDNVRGCWRHLPAVIATYDCEVCGRPKVQAAAGLLVCPDDSNEHRQREAALARQAASRQTSSPQAWPEGDLAYDGSNASPTRDLTARERDVLCRLISLVTRDPRYQHEEVDRVLAIRRVIDPRREDDT